MSANPKDSTKATRDDTIRTRMEPAVKEQWDLWCAGKSLTPSQVLRWLISMHLDQPERLWSWLAEQDKNKSDESGKDTGGGHGA